MYWIPPDIVVTISGSSAESWSIYRWAEREAYTGHDAASRPHAWIPRKPIMLFIYAHSGRSAWSRQWQQQISHQPMGSRS
jgi:hypothetical protein